MTNNDARSAVSYLYAFLRLLGVSTYEDPASTRTIIKLKPGSLAAWITGICFFLTMVAGGTIVGLLLVSFSLTHPKIVAFTVGLIGVTTGIGLLLEKVKIRD